MKRLAGAKIHSGRGTLGNEQPTPLPLPPEVREAIIASLAAMLVTDYQANHDVTDYTVHEGRGVRRSRIATDDLSSPEFC